MHSQNVRPKPAKKFQEETLSQPEGNWSSFQLANIASPQGVIDSDIAPFARMKTNHECERCGALSYTNFNAVEIIDEKSKKIQKWTARSKSLVVP